MTALPAPALRLALLATVVTLGTGAQPAARQAPPPMRGYTLAGAAAQRAIEARFRALPAADSIRSWHREFTKSPHVATSPRTKEIAEFIAASWQAQGLDHVRIHRYDVLSSNPRTVAVEMVAPVRYTPTLREAAIPDDPDSSQPAISCA